MKNSNIRSENRKALPKYLLLILAGAVVGGVLGFLSGMAGASDMPAAIAGGMDRLLAAIVPWGIPVSGVVLLGGGFVLYQRAKKLSAGWDGEDEDTVDRAEELLDWVLLLGSLAMILDFFFLAAGGTHSDGTMTPLAVTGCFLVSVALIVVLQQKVVDLTKTLNPEKHGSVYDLRFQKKWFESCDEAEKAQIGQAAYQAYKAGAMTCMVLWVALIILDFVFGFGLMPVFVVLLVWGVLQVTYTLACIRLSRRKRS